MCLIAFAIDSIPGVPLLLAGNRDEALARPTLPLHHWTTPRGTPVVGGRDEREGGTWLAATGPGAPHARVAWLTNVRQGRDTTSWPHSRGELPLRWLDGSPLHALVETLDPVAHGAFNLVVGDVTTGQWHWLTNRTATHDTKLLCQALTPGVYALSNAGLNTPWPKTVALRNALRDALAHGPYHLAAQDHLWSTLANRHTWPDDALPQTGVPLDWERALSAIWVDHPAPPGEPAESGYGTRTSALVSVMQAEGTHPAWQWRFEEHTWRPAAQSGRRALEWSGPAHR
jgi:uncharacterized protein with NRDE domain